MSATAVAALLVLATLAGAASLKYGHETSAIYKPDSYEPYEHKSGESYHEPSYESHYEEKGYRHRPHHDSYDEDHYGRDAYSVVPSYSHESSSPSYKQTHLPHYRHKRGADKKDDDEEDGKYKKDDEEDDDDEEEEEETEVSTETWINLAESLSLIAKKLDDDDGEDDDDDDEDDDEEESKMTESYTYKPMKKYRKSHKPRSYRPKRAASLEAGVTKSQAMGETMDLVDGLREDQKKKKCPSKCKKCKKHHCKRNCKKCKKCGKCK